MFNSRKKLRENLPRGTVRKMAKKHKCSDSQISKVIYGTADDPTILNELLKIAIKKQEKRKGELKLREENSKLLK